MNEFFSGFGYIIIYFVFCASIALLLRLKIRIEDEVFRKLLHGILLGSLSVWVFAYSTWWMAALAAVLFAIAVYPMLYMAENIKGYSKVVTERKSGELKSSLLIVFFMFAVVVAICWGWLGERMLTLACVYSWGFGDAAAALIGKRLGRHKIGGRIIKGRKSVEGTLAMFLVSFISVLVILTLRGRMGNGAILLVSGVTAAVSAVVELYTPNGLDTITCPFAAMAVMLPMIYQFGGI